VKKSPAGNPAGLFPLLRQAKGKALEAPLDIASAGGGTIQYLPAQSQY
jgi:hypothetical protein